MTNKKMTTITIRNEYHNSKYPLRVACLPARLSDSQVARCRRALCGIAGCTCGGNLGERGRQDVEIALCGGQYPGHIEIGERR